MKAELEYKYPGKTMVTVDGNEISNHYITSIATKLDGGGLEVTLGLYLTKIDIKSDGKLIINDCIGDDRILEEIYKKLKPKYEDDETVFLCINQKSKMIVGCFFTRESANKWVGDSKNIVIQELGVSK